MVWQPKNRYFKIIKVSPIFKKILESFLRKSQTILINLGNTSIVSKKCCARWYKFERISFNVHTFLFLRLQRVVKRGDPSKMPKNVFFLFNNK